MSIFAERLRSLRLAAGLSQTKFAQKVGSTRASISAYEVGDRTPDINLLLSITEKFEVSADYLLGLAPMSDRFADHEDIYLKGFSDGEDAFADALNTFLMRRGKA